METPSEAVDTGYRLGFDAGDLWPDPGIAII